MQDAKTEGVFLDRFVFSDESTFRMNEKGHRYNVRVLGNENPQEICNV